MYIFLNAVLLTKFRFFLSIFLLKFFMTLARRLATCDTYAVFVTSRMRTETSELYIFYIWNDNLQSFNREKNEASVPVFYADWTSVPVPRTSSLRGLDVGFIPLLPKELPYMANNDEYTDEYNDEYLCRDFFVGFNFWSRLSFQISEFRVH